MMYSNRSEHSHRGQYGERGSRQRDGYDNRREERREPHRDVPQDSYYKYGGDRQRGAERMVRNREYSDSPKRLYSTDSVNRDWGRKSPLRRRTSSSDWASSEKKRRRFTEEDDGDEYRYRRETEDKSNRLSPDSFSYSHSNKNLKHSQLRDEDFKYQQTTPDSRQKHQNKEYTYRHRDDTNCRPSSGYDRDEDSFERSWDRSQSWQHSQDYTPKVRRSKHWVAGLVWIMIYEEIVPPCLAELWQTQREERQPPHRIWGSSSKQRKIFPKWIKWSGGFVSLFCCNTAFPINI